MSDVTLADFKRSIAGKTPPPELPATLLALWHDARGDWTAAHETAQNIENADGAWIHAYLHRKEGDLGNASYWYRRAGKPDAHDALDAEWERIATAMIR